MIDVAAIKPVPSNLFEDRFLKAFLLALRLKHGDIINTRHNEHWERFGAVAKIVNAWEGTLLHFVPGMFGQYRSWDGALLNGAFTYGHLHTRSNAPGVYYWNFEAPLAEKMLQNHHAEYLDTLLALAQVYHETEIKD
jgi:hypothetical protein